MPISADCWPCFEMRLPWVGDGERRKRYVLCLNPEEAERERAHREQVLRELTAELNLLREREADHPKAACTLLASRRYGRYLTTDYLGRPRLKATKINAAEKFDGKFVVMTNDDTLSAEDVALGYKGAWIIESCFRRMKQTGLEVRPMFRWSPAADRGACQTLCHRLADPACRGNPLHPAVGTDRA